MKTNSICDEKLLVEVGSELARLGIFTAVSEIEQSAVLIYAKLRKAYIDSNKEVFVVDSNAKDSVYYSFLFNAVIVDVFSKARLKRVRDSFELNSALCLLDKYLHQLSTIAGTKPFKARSIFNDVIIDLPIDMQAPQFVPNAGPISPELHPTKADHHLDAMRYSTQYPCQFTGKCKEEGPKLCNHCEDGSCEGTVNIMVDYKGVCWGFRVDPELLGLDQPIQDCDIRVFKNFLKKGCAAFTAKASKIFAQLHTEYNEED